METEEKGKKISRIRRVEPFLIFFLQLELLLFLFAFQQFCKGANGGKRSRRSLWHQVERQNYLRALRLALSKAIGAMAAKSNVQFAILRIRRVRCVWKPKNQEIEPKSRVWETNEYVEQSVRRQQLFLVFFFYKVISFSSNGGDINSFRSFASICWTNSVSRIATPTGPRWVNNFN